MGTDVTVVNAARVSFGKRSRYYYGDEAEIAADFDREWEEPTFLLSKDEKLIQYLAKNRHMSPFGHCFASFHVKAPVFVARQLVKHKFLRWNEISRRYVDQLPSYYTPKFRHAVKNKKQGSGDEMAVSHQQDAVLDELYTKAHESYKYLIKTGVCPEQARIVLPQGVMTEWYWSGSLDAFADMCNLRLAPDTQEETRQVAQQISKELSDEFPVSWAALVKNLPPKPVNKKIRPMTDEERYRSTEREEINQAWYDGDGSELFE